MWVRHKTTPNSPRRLVQIVETVRRGRKNRQVIVQHLGVGEDDDDVARLKILGKYIIAELLEQRQPGLFPPEVMARMDVDASRRKEGKLPVDLSELEPQKRIITGFHEIYGKVYRDLGLYNVLPASRFSVSSSVLLHSVIARIAYPGSKRRSVKLMERQLGVSLQLNSVYRMMDKIGEEQIKLAQTLVGKASRSLLPDPTEVMFFDCTTLYFESQEEDGFRQKGFSKDGKRGETQVLLALLVTREGLPVAYDVLRGASHEGSSLIPLMRDMKRRHGVGRMICVADRGMHSRANLKALEEMGSDFVVGATLRRLPQSQMERVLNMEAYRPHSGADGRKVAEFEHEGRRLIVSWSPNRAARDARKRDEYLKSLAEKVKRKSSLGEMALPRGSRRFLRIEGNARLELDEEKIAEDARWDGLAGVLTDVRDMKAEELLSHYHGLWQVEESFRIAKHDLRIRPIFHWTENRIRAHLAICFMAYACVRYLMYRMSIQKRRMSAEAIRDALKARFCTVYQCQRTSLKYSMPWCLDKDAESIYAAMGVPLLTKPCALS